MIPPLIYYHYCKPLTPIICHYYNPMTTTTINYHYNPRSNSNSLTSRNTITIITTIIIPPWILDQKFQLLNCLITTTNPIDLRSNSNDSRFPTGHGSYLGLRQRRLRPPAPGAARGAGRPMVRAGAAGARYGERQLLQGGGQGTLGHPGGGMGMGLGMGLVRLVGGWWGWLGSWTS